MRVFGRHIELYSSTCESKEAPLAVGSLDMSIFERSMSVFVLIPRISSLYRLYVGICLCY